MIEPANLEIHEVITGVSPSTGHRLPLESIAPLNPRIKPKKYDGRKLTINWLSKYNYLLF